MNTTNTSEYGPATEPAPVAKKGRKNGPTMKWYNQFNEQPGPVKLALSDKERYFRVTFDLTINGQPGPTCLVKEEVEIFVQGLQAGMKAAADRISEGNLSQDEAVELLDEASHG